MRALSTIIFASIVVLALKCYPHKINAIIITRGAALHVLMNYFERITAWCNLQYDCERMRDILICEVQLMQRLLFLFNLKWDFNLNEKKNLTLLSGITLISSFLDVQTTTNCVLKFPCLAFPPKNPLMI